jgi:hypothetical protein
MKWRRMSGCLTVTSPPVGICSRMLVEQFVRQYEQRVLVALEEEERFRPERRNL